MREWLNHRFPPLVYGVLVAVFVLASQSVAIALSEQGQVSYMAGAVVFLFFLHLRIFDEHKDYERDVQTYPERALSRGAVTLAQLRNVAVAALILQLAGAATLGGVALAWWLAAFWFSVGMLVEFGVGEWLNRHMLLYAATHNPVTGLVVMFCFGASGASWRWAYLWFVVYSCAVMLAFELGRKIRLPHEEHAGVPSYSSELGQREARRFLSLTYLSVAACLVGVGASLGHPLEWVVLAATLVVVPGLATTWGEQPAKRLESASSVVLLASLAGVYGGATWLH